MQRTEGALLAGVCAGIARAFRWNVWVLRALFVALLLIKTLWALLLYAGLAVAFHLGQTLQHPRHREDDLTSPELSERSRRIRDLEKRFREMEKGGQTR
jgi:phage shock protein PspC (stress-responsive transcriptional regulator)